MGGFVVAHGHQPGGDIHAEWIHAEDELADAVAIERVLQVLERKGVVEHLDIVLEGRLVLGEGRGETDVGRAGQAEGGCASDETRAAGQKATTRDEARSLLDDLLEQLLVIGVHLMSSCASRGRRIVAEPGWFGGPPRRRPGCQ